MARAMEQEENGFLHYYFHDCLRLIWLEPNRIIEKKWFVFHVRIYGGIFDNAPSKTHYERILIGGLECLLIFKVTFALILKLT